MKERGEMPNEVDDAVRENKGVHEEDFWSSWQREEETGEEERKAKAEMERKKKRGEKGKREEGERRERNA